MSDNSTNDSQVVEEINIKVTRNAGEVERAPYTVVAESGLFKNGKIYEKGETIELDEKTAANFIALGEVE